MSLEPWDKRTFNCL